MCTGGDLLDRLTKEKDLSEQHAAAVMRQVLGGVAYLHAKNVVHRDIKPQNILFESPEKNSRIKIIDFCASRFFETAEKMQSKVGTPYYVSPEVLRKSYDYKCDVWSCGVILYILLSGHPPFDGKTNVELFEKVSRGAYKMQGTAVCICDMVGARWDTVSAEAKDLIKRMLTFDPEKRCTAKEALAHTWIQKYAVDKGDREITMTSFNEMRSFVAKYKLQQAGLTYIVSQLASKQEKHQLESVFLSLDKSKTGKLSSDDLVRGFKEVYGEGFPAEEEVMRIMDNVDMDKNGYIDYTEFVMATVNKEKLLSKERLESTFKTFDKVRSDG